MPAPTSPSCPQTQPAECPEANDSGALATMQADNATELLGPWTTGSFPRRVAADRSGAVGYRTALALPRVRRRRSDGSAAHDGSAADLTGGRCASQLLPQMINQPLLCVSIAYDGSFYPIHSESPQAAPVQYPLLEAIKRRAKALYTEEVLAVHYDRVNPVRRDVVAICSLPRKNTSFRRTRGNLNVLEG